jgi:plasmid stabilization system protein ParE
MNRASFSLVSFQQTTTHWGIRRRVHGNYLIFYRVREELVEVVHVLHGARDYETLFQNS